MSLAFGQCFSKVLFVYKEFYGTLITSDVVLFSTVALNTFDISQDSVAILV